MNLHGWLLNEDGAHLAASKRVIRMSLSSSSPVIDLGDHLLRISGFIVYVGFLKVSTSGVNIILIIMTVAIFILVTSELSDEDTTVLYYLLHNTVLGVCRS